MRALPLVFLVGCGGVTAEHPLTLKMGMTREQTVETLKTHKYCPKAGEPVARLETYPRCDRPGAEWGESWVTARYEDDRLVEVRRYERFSEESRATERWNQLITERGKISSESPEATKTLRSRLLEPGTRTVKAFRVDANTIAGVYLLNPTPPEEASVLEALILAPAESAKVGTRASTRGEAVGARAIDRQILEAFEMRAAASPNRAALQASNPPSRTLVDAVQVPAPTAMPKAELDRQILRAFESPAAKKREATELERQILRALESPAETERPIGDFPSACGYGRCERRQPFGFVE